MPPQAWEMVEVMLLQLWVFLIQRGVPWFPMSLPMWCVQCEGAGMGGNPLQHSTIEAGAQAGSESDWSFWPLLFPPHTRTVTPLNSIPFSFSLSQLNAL